MRPPVFDFSIREVLACSPAIHLQKPSSIAEITRQKKSSMGAETPTWSAYWIALLQGILPIVPPAERRSVDRVQNARM